MKDNDLNDLDELSRKALESVQNEMATRKDYEDEAASVKQALFALSAKENGVDFASALVDVAKSFKEQLPVSDQAIAAKESTNKEQTETNKEQVATTTEREQGEENINIGTNEREYLCNIHERILVLFSALQDDDGKRHLPLVVEFLEFLLASIEHRLKDQ